MFLTGTDGERYGDPRVVAADDIRDVGKSGTLEQAARDHAAVSAFAMNGDRRVGREVRERLAKIIQGVVLRLVDVPGLPLGIAANVEHGKLGSACGKLLH
jgi:hypothetical protein